MIKKISRLLGTVIILANLGFFIPLTIETLKSGGGGFGYGLLLLPINAITHLLLIPAILTWTDKSDKQYGFLITNSLGTLWSTFWFVIFITAIQPDNNELTETVDNVEKSTLITLTADNHPDKNFILVEDFEKSKGTFRPDTFELCDHSTDGGQLIAYHTKDKDYLVFDIWLFGETGKIHSTYWTDRKLNFKIIKRTDFVYDKPYYEKDYKVTETTEFYSYSDSSFKRYNSDKQEIKNSDNAESEVKVKNFFIDITKDIEIIK